MTTTLTEVKPSEPGWYWFCPNGKSPKSISCRVAVVVQVGEWHLYKTKIAGENLCARFPQGAYLVSRVGGLWSERIEEPEV